MSYCVVECGITYETDFKDTDALDAAIKKILKADVEGLRSIGIWMNPKELKQTWHQFII